MDSYPFFPGESGENTNPQLDKCNNFNYRKNDGSPTRLMQHYTVIDFNETIKTFTTNGSVSAHYVITKDGIIEEFVSPQYRAYHAGQGNLVVNSKLNPDLSSDIIKNDMNSWSIGIENVNTGNEEFTQKQIEANIWLCEHLCNTYPSINPKIMVGHGDWSYRKIDPGPFFPYEQFANASKQYENITKDFGIYPKKDDLDLKAEPKVLLSYKTIKNEDIQHYQSLFREYGFYIDEKEDGIVGKTTLDAILAYKLHFCGPEILQDSVQKTAWDNLWEDSSNFEARNLLGQFTENDLSCLTNIIEQF